MDNRGGASPSPVAKNNLCFISIFHIHKEIAKFGELIDYLRDEFDKDLPIYISNDNGYTFGPIRRRYIHEEWVDDEDEEEEEEE